MQDARVGDTITLRKVADKVSALPGYAEAKPQVFCGLFPVNADEYPGLRDALDKLQLNDAALSFEPEVSSAMGFGFRCGFLGMLHMDIVQVRALPRDCVVVAPCGGLSLPPPVPCRRGRRAPPLMSRRAWHPAVESVADAV